ncbi:MAG: hypothetical protein GX597_27595, partial [Anaerolineaceae bacterium]|nr:hypothetical protein [Anaerolineaceae bacterium]
FLKLTAMTAVGIMAASCAQPEAQPTSAPAQQPTAAPAKPTDTPAPVIKYKEAPMLAELVKAGKLPPVEDRLPTEPLVLPVAKEIGKYGGTWRRIHIGASDIGGGAGRLVPEALIQFSADGSEYEPNIFTKWEISDEGKTFTFHLRQGMKWSDGEPFTTDDIMYNYSDVYLNPELSTSVPAWLRFGGETAVVEKIDDFTFRMKFAKPYPMLVHVLAEPGYFAHPAHYAKQFHTKYGEKATIDAKMKEAQVETWMALYGTYVGTGNQWYDNVDQPTLFAWNTKSRVADTVHNMERNPYFWKVDPEGNQLPYIDVLRHDLVTGGTDIIMTKAISGELDMQGRHLGDRALLMENQQKGDYKIYIWTATTGATQQVMFNMSFRADEVKAKYIQDKKFHQAFSLAMNRPDYNTVIWAGMGKIRAATTIEQSADFVPEYAERYIAYDPAKANQMLDELGLDKKDAEGYRIAPETGKALELINYVATGYGTGAGMVTEYAKQVGLKIIPKEEERSIHYQRMLANELELSMWGMDGAIYPVWLNYAWWISPVWQQGSSRLGPAYGLWRTSGGKEGIEPTGDCMKMYELLEAAWLETDGAKRIELCKQMLDIASENCWTVSLGQITDSLMLVKNNFGNVPDQAISDWVFRTEKNTHPEQYYFKS